jgi:hypothetical protein
LGAAWVRSSQTVILTEYSDARSPPRETCVCFLIEVKRATFALFQRSGDLCCKRRCEHERTAHRQLVCLTPPSLAPIWDHASAQSGRKSTFLRDAPALRIDVN